MSKGAIGTFVTHRSSQHQPSPRDIPNITDQMYESKNDAIRNVLYGEFNNVDVQNYPITPKAKKKRHDLESKQQATGASFFRNNDNLFTRSSKRHYPFTPRSDIKTFKT